MSQEQMGTSTFLLRLVQRIRNVSWFWTDVRHPHDLEQLLTFRTRIIEEVVLPVTVLYHRAVFILVLEEGEAGE
jgi:hypothetical protein